MMVRSCMYGFPPTVLNAGGAGTTTVKLRKIFRPQKLVMTGFMREIRGRYRIKRSGLPPLHRDFVYGYSRIHKWSNGKIFKYRPGKTVLCFGAVGKIRTREYQPKSVVYEPVDPLEYIRLVNLSIGNEEQMACSGGVDARMFGDNRFGTGLSLPSSDVSISLALENTSDVIVTVGATIMGHEYDDSVTRPPPLPFKAPKTGAEAIELLKKLLPTISDADLGLDDDGDDGDDE